MSTHRHRGTPCVSVSAVVGACAAGKRGASFAAPVTSEDSVGEPPTPVGGGGRDQPHQRGVARAASADDRSSCDVDSSSLVGTPCVSVSAVVGGGAAGKRGASCAAPVTSEDSVGGPPTPVGGGGRAQPHQRGAARALSADDRSSCDVD